ncbi:hypothetical protein FPV67DRAFT_1198840 [Lyophyllum atratum]|nr:hypothetical protein FPV67DRAFT_1198840 [Lyophyllum atratum]
MGDHQLTDHQDAALAQDPGMPDEHCMPRYEGLWYPMLPQMQPQPQHQHPYLSSPPDSPQNGALLASPLSLTFKLPPIELPEAPGLCSPRPSRYTRTKSKSKEIVYAQALGWSFIEEEYLQWADDRNLAAGLENHRKRQIALQEIANRLPDGHRRLVSVRDKRAASWGGTTPCFIVGSNLTEEDLENAQNMDIIDQYRRVLGIDAAPKWYYLAYD